MIHKQDTAAIQAEIERKVKNNANWLDGKLSRNCLAVNSNMGSKKRKGYE